MKQLKLDLDFSDIKLNDVEKKQKPRDMIVGTIDATMTLWQQQRKGVGITDHRKIVRILNILDGKDKVELEDGDFDFLYDIFQSTNWTGGSKIIVKIVDMLDKAKLDGSK